jgi:hypothetical protein
MNIDTKATPVNEKNQVFSFLQSCEEMIRKQFSVISAKAKIQNLQAITKTLDPVFQRGDVKTQSFTACIITGGGRALYNLTGKLLLRPRQKPIDACLARPILWD